MTAQTSLFDIKEYFNAGEKPKMKRVHYKKPTYTKAYEFWHINPDTNEREYNGDEKHIFRVRTLNRLYSIIYGYCIDDVLEQFEVKEKDGMTLYGEDLQAEITGTSNLTIKQKVLLHIKLLRLLRKGFSVLDSLKAIRNGNYEKMYKEYRANQNVKYLQKYLEKEKLKGESNYEKIYYR